MNTLKISCQGADTLDIAEMSPFQGSLKILNKEEEAELRKEIEETGYAFPIHIWRMPDGSFMDGKKYIVGGHQRLAVLLKMREEGWEIPPVPVAYTLAETIELARRRVLQDVSQYGTVTTTGLIEFAALARLSIDEVEKSFRLPDIEISALREVLTESEEPRVVSFVAGSKEEQGLLDQKEPITCPNCAHVFQR